jgi:hypothetical protein
MITKTTPDLQHVLMFLDVGVLHSYLQQPASRNSDLSSGSLRPFPSGTT